MDAMVSSETKCSYQLDLSAGVLGLEAQNSDMCLQETGKGWLSYGVLDFHNRKG